MKTYTDPFWGTLTVDAELLSQKLAIATHAVHEASQAAQYKSENGYVISPISMVLNGLTDAIDAIISLLDEEVDE